MSCSRRSYYNRPLNKEHKTSSCVCSIVKDIDIAQKKVSNVGCISGCETSIKQLIHGRSRKKDKKRYTTIPFMLYSDGSNTPFIGSSVIKCASPDSKGFYYECVESPVLRVRDVDKNCCATLELLLPADCHGIAKKPSDHIKGSCSFFPFEDPVTNFIATDVCITVDLKKIAGISCLDPITPISAHG